MIFMASISAAPVIDPPGKERPHQVQGVEPFFQFTANGRNHLKNRGVWFDDHQLGHVHAAEFADPAEVVSHQVDDHHVFGPVFDGREQFLIDGFVVGRCLAAAARPLDRPALGHTIRAQADIALGRGRDHVPSGKFRNDAKGAGDAPQFLIQIPRVADQLGLEPMRQANLENVAGEDVLLATLDQLAAIAGQIEM